MSYSTKISSICLLLCISLANCNIPLLNEVRALAEQSSLGVNIETVDQDIYVLLNHFYENCRRKLNKKDLILLRQKMNVIDEQIYYVSEAYKKFKQLLRNTEKNKTDIENEIKLMSYDYIPIDRAQKIFEEITDSNNPVVIIVLGYVKDPSSKTVSRDSMTYLLEQLYEVLVYTEIQALAIDLYVRNLVKDKDRDLLAEFEKQGVEHRLSFVLNLFNKAVDHYTDISELLL